MSKEEMLTIAERNLKKAQYAFDHNFNRPGVTENERINLKNNLEYAKCVRDLITREA